MFAKGGGGHAPLPVLNCLNNSVTEIRGLPSTETSCDESNLCSSAVGIIGKFARGNF